MPRPLRLDVKAVANVATEGRHFVLVARLGPGTLLAPSPSGGFPLAVEEMRWQLEFLGRAAPSATPVSAD